MKRALAAGAGAALLLLCSAGPVAAAPPVIAFEEPSVDQRFSVSSVDLRVRVTMNEGTLRDDVVVTWSGPAGVPVPPEYRLDTDDRIGSVEISRTNQPFPWNGAYGVTVQATGRRSGVFSNTNEPATATQRFVVDAPPAAPTGVTTAVGGDRAVTVQWAANAEPDLFGYEVQRQLESEAWQRVTVADKGTTTVVDTGTTEQGGTYRYRVLAFRHSASPGELLASGPSSTSNAAKVPAPPVTTTTTTARSTTGTGQTESARGGGEAGSSGTLNRGGTARGAATGPTSSPISSSAGRVDLSNFASLLEQARQSGQAPPAAKAEEPDGGFDQKLPFAARPRSSADGGDDGGDDPVLGETLASDEGTGRVQSMAFLAGGLLATVLVMHLLWVQGQMRRAAVLDAIPPERPRRRRPTPSVGVG